MKEPILKVENLGISFSQYTKGLVRTDLEQRRADRKEKTKLKRA